MGKAFDYIIADYIGDKNEDACTAFVNALQGKAIDATCAGSSFCSFCLGTITDAAA